MSSSKRVKMNEYETQFIASTHAVRVMNNKNTDSESRETVESLLPSSKDIENEWKQSAMMNMFNERFFDTYKSFKKDLPASKNAAVDLVLDSVAKLCAIIDTKLESNGIANRYVHENPFRKEMDKIALEDGARDQITSMEQIQKCRNALFMYLIVDRNHFYVKSGSDLKSILDKYNMSHLDVYKQTLDVVHAHDANKHESDVALLETLTLSGNEPSHVNLLIHMRRVLSLYTYYVMRLMFLRMGGHDA